jgi:glycosyltransferase involved in cell wall biosynthesis
MNPLVSILLPAYNCEKYIRKTIDSLLNQTYANFELLIINDGSTDGTSVIINAYNDTRIQHLHNDGNKGLIYTLNRGLEFAKGKYIARIDADDVCLLTRLGKQVDWLEKNPKTAIVATQIIFINELDESTGNWPLDMQSITAAQIKKAMLWQSCIAHPSVLMRSEIIKQYRYSTYQKHSEDYDLWLQILSDGNVIEKVPEQLLKYRVHTASVTASIHRKKNPFFTNYNTKRKFLLHRIQQFKFGLFELKLVFTTIHDLLMGIGKVIKQLLKK